MATTGVVGRENYTRIVYSRSVNGSVIILIRRPFIKEACLHHWMKMTGQAFFKRKHVRTSVIMWTTIQQSDDILPLLLCLNFILVTPFSLFQGIGECHQWFWSYIVYVYCIQFMLNSFYSYGFLTMYVKLLSEIFVLCTIGFKTLLSLSIIFEFLPLWYLTYHVFHYYFLILGVIRVTTVLNPIPTRVAAFVTEPPARRAPTIKPLLKSVISAITKFKCPSIFPIRILSLFQINWCVYSPPLGGTLQH